MSITIENTKYLIVKKLGEGGGGRVIQAKSESDNKYYALKERIIRNETEYEINHIKKEAEILSLFNCKNIVKYYDSYLDKDKFYILMEYCDGQNLRDFINKNKNELIEENILYNIIKQICIGIKEIHNKNIIHRDLKPENIFMNDKKNNIKIGYFSISKSFGANKEYKIIKELGKGGNGRVIQVESKSDKKYYAIKEIIINNEKKDKIKGLQKEAEILSKFNCKNIVKYNDSLNIKIVFIY